MNEQPELAQVITIIQRLINQQQYQQILDVIASQDDNLRYDVQLQKIAAIVLMKLQRYTEARDCLQEVHKHHPERHDIKHNLAVAHRNLYEFKSGIECALGAVELAPDVIKYQLHLSQLYKQNNQITLAVNTLKAAREITAGNDQLNCELGALLNSTYEYQEAIEVLQKTHQTYYCFLLQLEARIALNHYEQAMSLLPIIQNLVDPFDEPKLIGFANMLTQLGQFESVQELLSKYRGSKGIEFMIMQIQSGGLSEQELDSITEAPSLANIEPSKQADLFYALSKQYFRLNNNDKGFHYCHQANQMGAPSDEYKAAVTECFDALENSFSNATMPDCKPFNTDLPVFIIGMPRSGTTLLENIIASHSKAFGAGETPYIRLMLNEMNYYAMGHEQQIEYVTKMPSWNTQDCHEMAGYYIDHLRAYDENADRIIDKLPHNFLHVGILQLLFPKARIIHIKRNPIANCLSIYKENLGAFHSYGNDLAYLATYYKHYQGLMQFWKERINTGNFLEINYEELVLDNEATVRKVIDFIDLEFEPSCLDFHESKRAVKTLSKEQVRNKLYTSSLTPWVGIEGEIAPLIKAFS